jgi:hypothetical protein
VLVALGPIVLVAAGITFIVVATVYVVEEGVEAVDRRRRIADKCVELMHECMKYRDQPEGSDYGTKKPCLDCKQECLHKNGQWPEYKCPRPN